MNAHEYNPAQQEAVNLLGAPKQARPVFDAGLRDELRGLLEERLKPLVTTSGSDRRNDDALHDDALHDDVLHDDVLHDDVPYNDVLYLSKYWLAQVLGCERKFMAELTEPFQWSPPTARGTVTHKAIELSVHWQQEAAPLELVDEAMARLENADKSIADYLQSCSEAERAELRAVAGASVTQFLECFPPLKPQWRPTTDSPIRAELHGGLIVLSGKPDLTLGQPDGTVAGKVIIDFKTGRFSPSHREDLRFYALLEALRILPPRLLATYYLDQGRFQSEAITRDLLLSAAERVIDGAHRYMELVSHGREPTVSPGPACKWCPKRIDCAEGATYLEEADNGDLY